MRNNKVKQKSARRPAPEPAPLPRLGVLGPIVALYGEGLGDPAAAGRTAAEVLLVLDAALALLGYSAPARRTLFGPVGARCYARLAAQAPREPSPSARSARSPSSAQPSAAPPLSLAQPSAAPPAELPALPDEPGIQRPNAKGKRIA